VKSAFITTIVGALLVAASAEAQNAPVATPPTSPAAANLCKTDPGTPPCATLDTQRTPPPPPPPISSPSPGLFTLFRNVQGLALFQPDITATTPSLGATWRVTTGLRVNAPGGVQISTNAVVRRGYALPVAMVQMLGSDVQLPETGTAAVLEFNAAPTRWDSEIRVSKTITSKGPVDVTIVGEAINLQNSGKAPGATPSETMLNSRTVRAGVVLGF
jgi:hypothetical protein